MPLAMRCAVTRCKIDSWTGRTPCRPLTAIRASPTTTSCAFLTTGCGTSCIDGVHYVTPSPVLRHQQLLGRLHLAIASFLEERPDLGQVFLSPLDTVFSPWDVVEPDLVFVAGDQLDILTEPNIQGAPALVVEILSPGTRRRDLGIKRDLFDRGGVREYWVIDPKALDVAV